jgi:hypothetical protein
VCREFSSGFLKVCGTDDVVAVEYDAGPVAGDLHGDPLGYATVDHIPHGSSAEVVTEHPE